MAKHRKEVETRKDQLAEANGQTRQLRLPRDLGTNGENGDRDLVNADARRSQEDRIGAGRARISASSFASEQRENRDAVRITGKRTKKDTAGRRREHSDGLSKGTVDVGPQIHAALQDRGQLSELLRLQANRKVERQLNAGKIPFTLDPAQGPSTTALPLATRVKVQRRIPRRVVDAALANNATVERESSSLERRATNRTSFRTTGKHEIRKPDTSLSPTSQRAAVEKHRPARVLQLSTPQAGPKSRAKSSPQSAGSTSSRQPRSAFSRGDLQRQLDASRSRQKASSSSRSQQTTSRTTAERRQPARALKLSTPQTDPKSRAKSSLQSAGSTSSRQPRSAFSHGDLQRQLNASPSRQKASSSRRANSSHHTKTRTIPQQRQPALAVQRSAPKPQAPARTKSATKSANSSRSSQHRSSFSSRDTQRRSSASRTRQQSNSSRVKQPPRAPSHQTSSSRSRASSARSLSHSHQPKRQSVNRHSSSHQKSSSNRQRQSKSSHHRSGGKKKNN